MLVSTRFERLVFQSTSYSWFVVESVISLALNALIVAPHAPATSSQISTVGRTLGLNAFGEKFGSLTGLGKSGGRKKKSGFPLWAPSEKDARGRPSGGLILSREHAQTNNTAPAASERRTPAVIVRRSCRSLRKGAQGGAETILPAPQRLASTLASATSKPQVCSRANG